MLSLACLSPAPSAAKIFSSLICTRQELFKRQTNARAVHRCCNCCLKHRFLHAKPVCVSGKPLKPIELTTQTKSPTPWLYAPSKVLLEVTPFRVYSSEQRTLHNAQVFHIPKQSREAAPTSPHLPPPLYREVCCQIKVRIIE